MSESNILGLSALSPNPAQVIVITLALLPCVLVPVWFLNSCCVVKSGVLLCIHFWGQHGSSFTVMP